MADELEVDVSRIPSPVLRRLIEEVRNDEAEGLSAYSRFHNRHNRSGYQRVFMPTMTDKELLKIVTGFRNGILDGRPSDRMCLAVCAPLESYLRQCGVETHAVAGTVRFGKWLSEHFWLELDDHRIIDPTADQFKELALPPVYLGPLPVGYTEDHE